MFLVLLAFLVWLFATGNYSSWAALLTSSASNTSSSTPVNSSPAASSSGGSPSSSTLGGALDALNQFYPSTASENPGASSASTPQDLIQTYTG